MVKHQELNNKLELFLNSISTKKEVIVNSESVNDNQTESIMNKLDDSGSSIDSINTTTQYDELIMKLEEIYKDTNYRHSYSIITRYIISHREQCIMDKNQEVLNIIAFNIENIFSVIDEKAKYENEIEFKNKVFKLKDHINLEIFRIRDIFDAENKTKAELEITKNELNNLKNESKNIKDNIEKSESHLKNMQKEYITILGVFAAIILSFVAGLTFSTSVLSNIDKSSVYRLAFIVCLIGLFITNILYYLYKFIREIHFGSDITNEDICTGFNLYKIGECFYKSSIFKFNFFIFTIMCLIFIYWKCFG